MEEPRKIVLILGNGFDLNLGLKTSYKDFWGSEFCPKDYPAPLIHHLNQCWPDSLGDVKWYDLENELLNYYKSLSDPNNPKDIITEEEHRFLETFEAYKFGYGMYNDQMDLIQSLFDKRIIVENKRLLCPLDVPYQEDCRKSPVWRDKKAFNLIKSGLCEYIRSLSEPEDRTKAVAAYVLLAVSSAYKNGQFVDIYTFNYTPVPTIGRIIDEKFIHHVHGDCRSGNIIIGTRDDLTINKQYDFLQKSFDTNYNPPALVQDLTEADEVIIVGHSLGENDRQYFMPYFKQQASYGAAARKYITIFTYDEASKIETKRSLQRMTDGNLSTLYGRNNLQIIKTSELAQDQGAFKDFLMKFFFDESKVESIIERFL